MNMERAWIPAGVSPAERRRLFSIWIRTGRIPTHRDDGVELKFNPWHDPRDGRFTSGPGAEATRATITALRDDLLAEHLAMTPDQVTQGIKEHGSLIAMIDANRGTQGQGRTLIPYEIPELSGFEAWLAENEILDPEGPDKIFEPLGKRKGLIRRWHWPKRLKWRRRKSA